jgi:hypothetical protein
LKRFLNAQGVTDIATGYEAGKTTQQVGTRYGISHTTVAAAFRRQAMQLRPRPGGS